MTTSYLTKLQQRAVGRSFRYNRRTTRDNARDYTITRVLRTGDRRVGGGHIVSEPCVEYVLPHDWNQIGAYGWNHASRLL